MNTTLDSKTLALYAVSALAVCGSLLALTFVYGEMVSIKHPASQGATITVTGEGEATAMPDIATVTFTVREEAKTVPEAQKKAEAKIKLATDALKDLKIVDKDIKTLSYNVYPKYESDQKVYCMAIGCPVPQQVISGYEVSQSLQVKVRKIDATGDVIGAIGGANISEISGPEFTVDDMDKVTGEAKNAAIQDARQKAEALADSLDVDLGRIVGYNENNYGYPSPMAAYTRDAYGKGGATNEVAPTLPQGELLNKINVSITYELR